MADPAPHLVSLLQSALAAALGPSFADADPVLRQSDRADYQANAAMALAKQLGRAPRDVALEVAAALPVGGPDDVLAAVEVAGPGFLNLTLSGAFLGSLVETALSDARLGVGVAVAPETVVVDYSHPNVAKEMHVGHLRSTIIGDAIVRMFDWLGHRVVRQNHIGDWGTPFGMLIEHLLDLGEEEAAHELSVGDLNGFYKEARAKFEASAAFADRARERVVLLQGGDADTLRLWGLLVEESTRYFETVYSRLGVTLTPGDLAGESSYNALLADVCSELLDLGLARVDDGALCVFPAGFAGRDGTPQPLIIRNSVGGYTYATTDLAAVRHRVRDLGATLVVYVVGAPQAQHLAMVFQTAREAGWLAPPARAEHASFGSVLGEDGRMYKTRSGDSVKLSELLDEAVARALAVVVEKSRDLSGVEQAGVAEAVGIGAVKYADLSSDRVKDYVFNWDRMLSFDGNTAPYLQYAHARCQAILRRAEVGAVAGAGGAGAGGGAGGAVAGGGAGAGVVGGAVAGAGAGGAAAGGGGTAAGGGVIVDDPAERALALALLSFESAVTATVDSLAPHRLCTYLFELASTFTTFYEKCPVLIAPTEELRASRLALVELTARTLRQGLDLLGIATPDRM